MGSGSGLGLGLRLGKGKGLVAFRVAGGLGLEFRVG